MTGGGGVGTVCIPMGGVAFIRSTNEGFICIKSCFRTILALSRSTQINQLTLSLAGLDPRNFQKGMVAIVTISDSTLVGDILQCKRYGPCTPYPYGKYVYVYAS